MPDGRRKSATLEDPIREDVNSEWREDLGRSPASQSQGSPLPSVPEVISGTVFDITPVSYEFSAAEDADVVSFNNAASGAPEFFIDSLGNTGGNIAPIPLLNGDFRYSSPVLVSIVAALGSAIVRVVSSL